MNESDIQIETFLRQVLFVRRFEERVLDLFSEGELFGTTHACIGQEAIPVGVLNHLEKRDIVISNHRCHGHYLVRTGDAVGLMAELMGKEGGVCAGRGGSQHLCCDNFYTNGIQGNMAPVAAGMAYTEKVKESGAIVTIFVGDGTFGEGSLYEALNMASLWSVPLLLVIENNKYAQTTPLALNFAGSFIGRAAGFGVEAAEIESNDAEVLHQCFDLATDYVRSECRPFMQVVHTYRVCPHSKGDDFRDTAEIDEWKKQDPVTLLQKKVSRDTFERFETSVSEELKAAEEVARAMPFADISA